MRSANQLSDADMNSGSPGRRTSRVASQQLASAVVTQEELQELQTLRAYAQRCERLRVSIVDRMEQGARLEPGPLTAVLRQQASRYLNARTLTPLLGAEEVEALRQQVTPTVSTQLRVCYRHSGHSCTDAV